MGKLWAFSEISYRSAQDVYKRQRKHNAGGADGCKRLAVLHNAGAHGCCRVIARAADHDGARRKAGALCGFFGEMCIRDRCTGQMIPRSTGLYSCAAAPIRAGTADRHRRSASVQ